MPLLESSIPVDLEISYDEYKKMLFRHAEISTGLDKSIPYHADIAMEVKAKAEKEEAARRYDTAALLYYRVAHIFDTAIKSRKRELAVAHSLVTPAEMTKAVAACLDRLEVITTDSDKLPMLHSELMEDVKQQLAERARLVHLQHAADEIQEQESLEEQQEAAKRLAKEMEQQRLLEEEQEKLNTIHQQFGGASGDQGQHLPPQWQPTAVPAPSQVPAVPQGSLTEAAYEERKELLKNSEAQAIADMQNKLFGALNVDTGKPKEMPQAQLVPDPVAVQPSRPVAAPVAAPEPTKPQTETDRLGDLSAQFAAFGVKPAEPPASILKPLGTSTPMPVAQPTPNPTAQPAKPAPVQTPAPAVQPAFREERKPTVAPIANPVPLVQPTPAPASNGATPAVAATGAAVAGLTAAGAAALANGHGSPPRPAQPQPVAQPQPQQPQPVRQQPAPVQQPPQVAPQPAQQPVQQPLQSPVQQMPLQQPLQRPAQPQQPAQPVAQQQPLQRPAQAQPQTNGYPVGSQQPQPTQQQLPQVPKQPPQRFNTTQPAPAAQPQTQQPDSVPQAVPKRAPYNSAHNAASVFVDGQSLLRVSHYDLARRVNLWAFNSPSATPGRSRRGLVNLGNTCYLNSVTQVLSVTPLGRYFRTDEYIGAMVDRYTGGGKVANTFTYVMRELREPISMAVSASHMKKAVAVQNDQFAGFSQQDAHEFLSTLVDQLHEDLNSNSKQRFRFNDVDNRSGSDDQIAARYWAQYSALNDSPVTKFMAFQERSTITCTTCKASTRSFTPTMCVTVPIPELNRPISIEDCMANYVKEELLGVDSMYSCGACKQKTRAIKSMAFYGCPKVLMVTLKRFKSYGNFSNKVTTSVMFQPRLDFAPYLCGTGEGVHPGFSKAKGAKTGYTLVGIVNHQGNMHGGHYTADTRPLGNGDDAVWFHYSDEVFKQQLQGPNHQLAYILCYVRDDALREFS